jgi:hypothetical protein
VVAKEDDMCRQANLVSGWTYNILVSANGGPGTPLEASLRVTV